VEYRTAQWQDLTPEGSFAEFWLGAASREIGYRHNLYKDERRSHRKIHEEALIPDQQPRDPPTPVLA
jgi:hypothetical protein